MADDTLYLRMMLPPPSCADDSLFGDALIITSLSPAYFGAPPQTYYGNALCCAWSPDGRWLAAGGEDDLVSLFSMEQQRMVAWGEGHTSWVSALSFDPW